jgi:uncharacterized pyridoxal phosphate-containing UPF0001 family protein
MNVADVRSRLAAIREEAGPDVTVVCATKYVSLPDMAILLEAGVTVAGENRAQDLERKHAEYGDAFRWHFIGRLQSNKARLVSRICELVHSVDTDSTARRLTIPWLLEVRLVAEATKGGVAESEIGAYLARYPEIRGLMTMPPAAQNPEASRAVFRRLRELGCEHGLAELSMGTSQDWRVAVQEGATLIRVGSALFGGGRVASRPS